MLLEDVRQRLFAPTDSPIPRMVGAELELIPVYSATHTVAPALASARALSRLAIDEHWRSEIKNGDPPSWNLPDESAVSFEPGGQIEISSSPHEAASSLIDSLQRVTRVIQTEMEKDGITLISRGVDPYNDIASVPLQLSRERYIRMTDYFNSIGPSGIRMMRQTAALQINVEKGREPLERWALLNALAPVVTGLFANSRQYAAADSGFASYRAQLWRTLDPTRTGLAYDAKDPPLHYLEFALDAGAIRSGGRHETTRYQRFRDWMRDSDLTIEDWHFHLSTLFPEVRPKAYFELRSADTIDVEWLAAPIVFVIGLVYDPDSARDASALLGEPSVSLMEAAGRDGLRNGRLRKFVGELTRLSIEGAKALGEQYLSAGHVAAAREYFTRALDGD